MQNNTRDPRDANPSTAPVSTATPVDMRTMTTPPESAASATAPSRPSKRRYLVHPLWLALSVAALFGLIFGVGALVNNANQSTASAPSGTTIEATTISVIRTVDPSVVQIQGRGPGRGEAWDQVRFSHRTATS